MIFVDKIILIMVICFLMTNLGLSHRYIFPPTFAPEESKKITK